VLHDRPLAGIRRQRKATADHLAEGDDVRIDAIALDRTAWRDSETGHHLVEQKQRAMAAGDLAKSVEETIDRLDHAHVAGDRLDDHPGDFVAVGVEERLDAAEVVVARHQGVLRRAAGNAGLSGSPSVATPLPAWTSSMSPCPW